MENDQMKCEKCGGNIIKVGENTMKCEKCGHVVNTEAKEEEKKVE